MLYLRISISICIFGILANSFMILLLTRPRMGTTVNRLLALVTFADALLMSVYLIYIFHFEIGDPRACPVDLLTFPWVVFQLIQSNLSVYLRAFSLWLSVVMAGYRNFVLSRSTPLRKEKSSLALKLGSGVALVILLVCIPIFLQNTIVTGPKAPENNTVCPRNHSVYYTLRPPQFVLWENRLLLKAAYWINGLILKLLPCVILNYYLISVVVLMYRRHLLRKMTLFRNRSPAVNYSNKKMCVASISSRPKATMMPTSLILVIILLATVLCELPNATLSVMSGLMPYDFLKNTYVRLGEMMDLLSLFSCTTTSILYFAMSRSLRKSFIEIFSRESPLIRKSSPTVNQEMGQMIENCNDEGDPLKASCL